MTLEGISAITPQGARGGLEGAPSSITVTLPDGSVLPPMTKFTRRLPPGTIVRVETAGGGGFGDPGERPGASRAGDLADGLIPMREES